MGVDCDDVFRWRGRSDQVPHDAQKSLVTDGATQQIDGGARWCAAAVAAVDLTDEPHHRELFEFGCPRRVWAIVRAFSSLMLSISTRAAAV